MRTTDAGGLFPSMLWQNEGHSCGHQVKPDPAQLAERHGADTLVLDWRDRLVCSECGCREVDFVVTEASL
jgi:hypothetical protein